MSFLKKVWNFIITDPEKGLVNNTDTPIIICAGEPICTIIIEGVGSVDIKNQKKDIELS